jgi:hypothetical protein
MQIGNTSDAIFNLFFMIPRMIDGGVNLLVIKKEIESYQQLAKLHHHPILETYMQVSLCSISFVAFFIQCKYNTQGNHHFFYQWFMDSITPLINSDTTNAITPATTDKCGITDATAIHVVQLMIPAIYLGHLERVLFLEKRWESMSHYEKCRIPMRNFLRAFYFGLASSDSYRRKKNRWTMADIDSSVTWLQKGKWTLPSSIPVSITVHIFLFHLSKPRE